MTTDHPQRTLPSAALRRLGAGAALTLLVGCADPRLPAAPGALVVVVARTADVLGVESALLRAGLIEGSAFAPLGPALVADAPVVASVLPSGAVVIATRIHRTAATGILPLGGRSVLGSTVALDIAGRPALARLDSKRALVAFNVPADDEATTAALLEMLAADAGGITPPLPPRGTLSIRGEPASSLLGAVDGSVTFEPPSTLVIALSARGAPASLRAALASSSPPWACALDEGAAAVLAIPALAEGDDERFKGRMLVAVYPPAVGSAEERDGVASVIVAGTPLGSKAKDDLLEGLREGTAPVVERTEGSRRFLDVNTSHAAGRRLRAVVDDAFFLLAVGDTAPVDRVTAAEPKLTCPPDVRPLVRIDGARLHQLLLPLLVTPDVVWRALALSSATDAIPLARLRGIERLEVDARTEGDLVTLAGRIVVSGGGPAP
jgi:hypothetical protein